MADKKNDMLAVMLNQPEATYEDMLLHGVTADNTGLKDKSYYKDLDVIQNNSIFKNEYGKFDETKFDNFYESVQSAYNTFSNNDYEKKVIESLEKDPLDWTQPFKTDVKDVSAIVYKGSGDFGRRSKGITGIGSIGSPVFSMREIAQANEAKDENGNGLGWAPNNHRWIKSIFDPTLVLATYDEDGTHLENGVEVKHRKGDFKLNENGDPFYENLGNRDPYGKEVLRWTDTLTVDGTPINKWDFLDSDGLDKSITKTIMQTVAYVAPLLIPGTQVVWGTIGMAGGLASALPTLLKGINGIIGNNDSDFGRTLTKAEGWLKRWSPTQSDAGKGKFMSWENFGEIIRSSSIQLFSQRRVAELSRLLLKGGDTFQNTNIGQKLSLAYMALTSSQDSYSMFKESGANDAVAGIGMLATMGALYELMNLDYFKDALFKGSWLDESEANNIIKNYSRDNIARLAEAETGKNINDLVKVSHEEAANLFMRIKNGVKKGWTSFVKSSASGTPKDLTVAKSAVEGGKNAGARKALSTFNVILNRSVNEGVEETMEEVAQDLIKGVFAGAEALGINMTDSRDTNLDFGWSFGEAMQRYLTSFGGGFFGGAVFEGITQYENAIYNRLNVSDLNDTSEQLLFLVLSGKGNEIKERAKIFRDRELLGNKNLSVKNFTKDDKGNIRFAEAKGDDNQNEFAYQLITHEVDRLEKILSDVGITGNSVQRWLIEFAGNVDKLEHSLDNPITAAIKKLGMHTTFMDDLVDLSKKLVSIESQIDSLKPKRDSANDSENSESQELKNLQKLKSQLIAEKDAFFNHENDREYIQQAMYISDSRLQRKTLATVLDEDITLTPYSEEDYALTGDTGFANYMWLRYHKKLNDLSELEKEFYKKEYDAFASNPDNISDIQNVGKTLFQIYKSVNEHYAPKLIEAEATLKDTVSNPVYKHLVQFKSAEYQQYLVAKSALDDLNLQIKVDEGKLATLTPDSDEYIELAARIETEQSQRDEAELIIENYEALYDPIKDILTDVPTAEGVQIKNSIQDSILAIKDFKEIINNPDVSEELKTEARLGLRTRFKTITDSVLKYFNTLQNNNTLAGNTGDLLLRNVMKYADEVSDVYKSLLSSSDSDISDLFGFSNYSYEIEPVSVSLLKDALKSGDINAYKEALDGVRDKFGSDTRIAMDDASDEQIAEEREKAIDTLQKSLFGENLEKFFEKVDQSMKSIKTYGLIDLLEDMQIGVGDDVRPLLQLIDENKKSLLGSTDLSEFSLQPNAETALKKARSMISFAILAIEAAYNGYNETVNALPKTSKDVELAVITENTKNRLVEEIKYTMGVINTMLEINENNVNSKKAYAQKAEAFFHKNLMDSLLNGETDNPETWLGKFNDKFHVNLKDIWEQAGSDTSVTVDNSTLTTDNYSEFKKRFVRFWQLLRTKLLEEHTESEIGTLLGELLDGTAKLGQYGEIKTEDDSNGLTNLGIVVCAGIFLNEDYGDFFLRYMAEQEEKDYPYMPFMQQELAIHASYEFAISGENSILTQIANAINDKKVELKSGVENKDKIEERWNKLKLLNQLFFIQGGTGAGKTSATSLLTYRLLKKRNGDSDWKPLILAPTTNQVEPYLKTLGLDPKYEDKSTFSDFIAKLVKGLDEYKDINFYSLDKDSIDANIRVKIFEDDSLDTELSTDFIEQLKSTFEKDSLKGQFIFADECQFLNVACLQILNAFAEVTGAKVLMYGDKKQNGAFYKKDGNSIESSIADALVLSCPSLGESLRFANIAKERNYKAIKNVLQEIENKVAEKYTKSYEQIASIAKDVVTTRNNQNLGVSFVHYESDDTFVGEKSISNSEIDKYFEKFKSLSAKLHEGKSRICIITDDKTKYLDKQSEGVDVLSPAEVQGREYDYVLIDKPFDDSNLYSAYKDVYTLMGRSKYGTVFTSNLNDLNIKFSPKGDKALSNEINNEVSFAKYAEWKGKMFIAVKEILKPKESDEKAKDEEKPKEGEKPKEKSSEEILDFVEEAPIDGANSGEEASFKTEGVESKNEKSKKTSDFEESVSNLRKKVIDDLKVNDKVAYNWNDFVDFAENRLLNVEGLSSDGRTCGNAYSILSSMEKIPNATSLITFFRKFASAVVYNMEIQPHHVITFTRQLGIDRKVVTELVSSWNNEIKNGKHTFVSYAFADGKSVVYWKTTVDGKIKLIPVSLINGTLTGKATLSGREKLFTKADEFRLIKGLESDTCLRIDQLESSVGTVSQLKILTPFNVKFKANDYPAGLEALNGTLNEGFIKNNSGHGFVLFSDCEILENSDFEKVFNFKKDKDGEYLYTLNAKSLNVQKIEDEDSKFNNTVITADINGAQVPMVSINPHRYVDLETLYNIANIARFAANQIAWQNLSDTQRALIGEESRKKAEEFISTYLGKFELEDTSTSMAGKNREANAKNKRKLKYDYRLLSMKATYNLLGCCSAAFYQADQDNGSSLFNAFSTGLIEVALSKQTQPSRAGIRYKQGFLLNVGNNHYFVTGETEDGKICNIRCSKLNYSKGVFTFQEKSRPIVLKGLKPSELNLLDIISSIDSKLTEEEIITKLGSGSIQVQFLQHATSPDGDFLFTNDDYNVVCGLFHIVSKAKSKNPNIYGTLEKYIKTYNTFKDGFTLNENRKISTEEEEKRKNIGWASSKTERSELLKSNVRKVEGSIWTVDRSKFDSNLGSDIPVDIFSDTPSTQEREFLFEESGLKWENGNVWMPNARIDDKWLAKFTEESTFTHNGKPVTKARLNSVNFASGKIEFTVGLTKIQGNLKKNEVDESYPTVDQLSGGQVKVPLHEYNGVKYRIAGGKVMVGSSELKPLMQIDDQVVYSDGNRAVLIKSGTLATNDVSMNVPVVKNIAPDIWEDLDGNLYTSVEKLGKISDYSENMLIFANGKSIEYEKIPEDRIPQSIKEKHIPGQSNPISKPARKFGEKPESFVKRNGFAHKDNGGWTVFFGKSWIVNGAWLYNNTQEYDGGDGRFVVVGHRDNKIIVADERIYTLNNNVQVPELSVDNGLKLYFKSVLNQYGLLNDESNEIIDAINVDSVDIDTDNLEAWLNNKGYQAELSDEVELLLSKMDINELAIQKYVNTAKLKGFSIYNSVQDVIYASGLDESGESMSIYAVNGHASEGYSYDKAYVTLDNWINDNSSLNNHPIITALNGLKNNLLDSSLLQSVIDFLDSDEAMDLISDEAYNDFMENVYIPLRSIQKLIENLRNDKTNCEWHA